MAAARPEAKRPPQARRGIVGRIVGIVAGLALAAAAVWAQTNAMPYEERGSFLTTKGKIGQVVKTNRYSVKVTSVTAARAVDTKTFSGEALKVRTSHVFLLVNVSATTVRQPMDLSTLSPPALLTVDGRRYDTTDRVDQSLTLLSKRFQPGLWSSGLLVYELPKDAVPGVRFIFAPSAGAIPVDTSTPEAEIDLGLTPGAADKLISQAPAYRSLVNKTS
ncbi:hypothetical protein Psi02_72920 [Planotetraspora silvatica]|uniref:DUF4352 domain-containing protein n=1 Tax=Planotetraspora silvatica TaxID=234614 RepID=A0A8J3XVR3_9ACTN|nr:DUF4352 domain-containing protein [Planotetraspora silvatica]GII50868.1 hypothetical protein Psi02_72920 [Planotetraspora silvatica]